MARDPCAHRGSDTATTQRRQLLCVPKAQAKCGVPSRAVIIPHHSKKKKRERGEEGKEARLGHLADYIDPTYGRAFDLISQDEDEASNGLEVPLLS